MKAMEYYRPASLDAAVNILREHESVRILAGGTDLLGTMEDQIHGEYPRGVLSLKDVDGLDYIREDEDGLKIGAMTRLSRIEEDEKIKGTYSLLAEAAHRVASPQIRNRGTIGGNICQEPRCWYYRYPDNKFHCMRKGGDFCNALTGRNLYHSIFGAAKVGRSPCETTCPAGTEIPRYMGQLRKGEMEKAARTIFRVNPLAAVTGRVCPHECQDHCNRNLTDTAVAIRNAERALGDYILEHQEHFVSAPEKESGKKVAVIGSGPAGLTAAFYLRSFGHKVTVFDKNEKAGGMLRYAIPEYRLPSEVVDRTVEMMEKTGITFRLGKVVDPVASAEEYRKNYDSVFDARGAWQNSRIHVKGGEMALPGLDFLYRIRTGEKKIPGQNVVVVGGGNVAMDAAASARRLGSEKVTVVYRRTREEMPAHPWEVEETLAEGVALLTSRLPVEILGKDGKVTGLRLVKSFSGGSRDSTVEQDLSDEIFLEADCVIMAVGQQIEGGRISVDEKAQRTDTPGIYAGGDVTTGPATVISAIACGRRGAEAMDRELGGRDPRAEEAWDSLLDFSSSGLVPSPPGEMPLRPRQERGISCEDALGWSGEDACGEAHRCYNCGCVAVNPSDIAPVLIALDGEICTTRRRIPAENFFAAQVGTSTILEADELVTEIRIPRPEGKQIQVYRKFRLRKSIDFPVVCVALRMDMDGERVRDARIVLGGVMPVPSRRRKAELRLIGGLPDPASSEEAAQLAVEGALPLAENAYKVAVTKALVRRAVLGIR